MSKALLIKSYTDITIGGKGVWNNLNMAVSYIQGIETGKILEGLMAEKLGTLISGVPTPWARAKLFKFAMQTLASPDPNINQAGLWQFYNLLYDEWKGLVAVIALFPDRVRFSKPVKMNVKGEDYDIASAFGRMLFDEKDLWSDQDDNDPDRQPYIHLIYYRDHLVGGTSPFTGVFTGVDYSTIGQDASDISWYREGKFEDPTRFLTPDQLQKVYLFVKNMNGNIDAFEKKINSQRGGKKPVDIGGFKKMSRDWEKTLLQRGQGQLRDKGPVAKYPNLANPFSLLLKSDVPVFMKPDTTFTYSNEGDYQRIGDIQSLLSDDKYVIGWTEEANERPKLADGPVFLLSVKDIQSGDTNYFSLPLSERGVDIFKNSLSSLLGYTDGGNTRLTAQITDSGQLAVTLVVEIDGQAVTLNTREYEIDWMADLRHVIMWPDFVSERWNKYYLYSEFTSGANERFTPVFKKGGEFVRTIDGDFLTGDYERKPDEEKKVDVKRLLTYPPGQGDELPKYNIISADVPMAGLSATVQDTGKDVHAGFLLFRPQVVKDLSSTTVRGKAVVGIDFGSNNTCVYYKDGEKNAEPIVFENNRIVLVGKENTNPRSVAEINELLFFTNYPSANGQLKSWLHEHDTRYYDQGQEGDEIVGGVPVNRPNVWVRDMDDYEITTQAGKLHYNMKWLDDDRGLKRKKAFIKSIWLNVCAYLYKKNISPERIAWSYPGSMMEADITEMAKIFEDAWKITPIAGTSKIMPDDDETPTEAEAVCSFALSQDFGLTRNKMFLGIDVGGSTSDILLIANDVNNGNKATLYRESSVRLAAGVFFNAVIKSEQFREALYNFHESKKTDVYVANINEILTEPSKAPYYLNSIFDQLNGVDDYEEFYTSIDADAKFVFTIPAYVTGLLLFYSGILIGNTVKAENLDIDSVDILSFGKGGRLFHWLRNSAGGRATSEYYAECLNAGVSLVLDKEMKVKYRSEIEVDNKAEVAKGLVENAKVEKKGAHTDSDICGEDDVRYIDTDGTPREIHTETELTGDYFANDMSNFDFSSVPNFEKFMNIFIDFVSRRTRMYPQADNDLREDIAELPNSIAAYIRNNDTEYKKARKKQDNGFKYHQPLIIAEGICFLNKTLIQKAFNQ